MNFPRRLLALLLLPCGVGAASSDPHPKAKDCDSLAGVPIDFSNDYNGVFDRSGCTSCHSGAAPPADLDLSRVQRDPSCVLVDIDAVRAPIKRVEPGNPALSLLFQVINCDAPDGAFRMAVPPLADQAVIHDWIARGAPVAIGDCTNPNLGDGFESVRP